MGLHLTGSTQTQLNSVGLVIEPTGTATANRQTLADGLTAAATFGAPAVVKGAFSIAGSVAVPAGTRLDNRATITQTTSLTPFFTVNTANVRISGGTLQGKTTDYTNASSVYGAAGVRVDASASNVTIVDVSMQGIAGLGVQIAQGADKVTVRDCVIVGPGPSYLLNTTYNYSAGVRSQTSGRWRVQGCDISGYAQGVVTNSGLANVHIIDNFIHDIPSQHGLYIDTIEKATIRGNIIRNCGLLGMKVQIPATGIITDPNDIVIHGNMVSSCGAQGILLTNTTGGSNDAAKVRRTIVSNNVLDGTNRGIEANNCVNLHISDNIIYNSTGAGIILDRVTKGAVTDNRIDTAADQGILLNACTDVETRYNRIIDPANTNNAATEHGIHITGVSLDLTFVGNRVTDSAGNMRYGVYSNPTSGQPTFGFRGNYSTGATDYGARLVAGTAVRAWLSNDFAGTLGGVLNPVAGAVTPYGGPGQNGLVAAVYDPVFATANLAPMTPGVLYVVAVVIGAGSAASRVRYTTAAAAVGATTGQCFTGVYSAAGALLGTSADLAAAWATPGDSSDAVTVPFQPDGTTVYVAFLFNGTTAPTVRGATASGKGNINISAAPRFATGGTGLTALPSTLPALAASAVHAWAGLS